MSILQEYGDIRRQLGEEEWNMIDKFLSENNQYQLSDVLYKEKVWKIYEDWKRGSSDMKINRKNVKSNRKINRRAIKAAESYGWEVDSSEAWEAYEFACDYFGKENLDDQIVSGLSTDELAESLVYIFRMNDFREWDERNGGSDEDEDEEILYELDDAGKGFTNEYDYIEYASEHITELSDDDLYSVWKEAKDTAERWAKSEYESLQELAKKFQELFELANAEDERRSDAEGIEESRKLRGKRAIKSSKRRNTRRPVKAARITTDFSNFKPWSGAVDTWNELEKWDKIDLLEQILDDTYYNEEAGEAVLSETELNDLLWFEPETVYEWVGLYYNDETGEVSDEPFDEEDEDEDEDIEESTKVRGRKSVKANRKAKNRKPVNAAETVSGDMFEQVFNESLSNLNDVFKGNMAFDATVGSVYGASHDRVYPGDGIDFLYNLRDLAAANEGQNIMDYISSYLSDPIYLAVIDDTIDEYIGENISGEDMNNIDPTVAPGFVDEWYNMFYDDCDILATQVSDDICRYLTSFAMSVEDIDAEMLNYPDNDDMIEDDFLIWKIYK